MFTDKNQDPKRAENGSDKTTAQAGEGTAKAGCGLNPPALIRNLEALDEATCQAIDAEVARREAAGIGPDLSRYADPGPDPVGIDWAWASPDPTPQGSAQKSLENQDRPARVEKRSD